MDSLILDIGGDVGALVINTGPELDEQEIEISPGSDPATPRSHNQVHARRGLGDVAYTAVFPSVPAGAYTVWHRDGTPHAMIMIAGGQVTQHEMT